MVAAYSSKYFDSSAAGGVVRQIGYKIKRGKIVHEGLYIFGGSDHEMKASNDLLYVDTSSSLWKLTKLNVQGAPPIPRYDHCCHLIESLNTIVFYGGRRDNCPRVSLSDCFALDLQRLMWTRVIYTDKNIAIPRYGFQSFINGTLDSLT